MPTEYKGWPSLCYYHLIMSGRHRVDETAEKMAISPSSLYKYCEGEVNFPVDLIPRLYNATHEKEFLDFLVKGTDQIVLPRPGAEANGRSLEIEMLDVAAVVGELAKHITTALEDGRLSEAEAIKAERTLNRLQREAEGVREKLKGEVQKFKVQGSTSSKKGGLQTRKNF